MGQIYVTTCTRRSGKAGHQKNRKELDSLAERVTVED